MVARSTPLLDGRDAEAAARASFLRMTPGRWRLIRAFERLIRPLLPLIPARPQAGRNASPSRILVVEYWNLGDIAIVVPFLRNLRASFPGSRISLLVHPRLASFLEGQGLVDEFIPVPVPWAQHFSRWKKYNPFSVNWVSLARALASIRGRQFDWAFSGRMDVRDNLLLWLSGASRRIAYGFAGGAFLLTDSVLPDLSRPHRSDVWLHLLEGVGLAVERNPTGFTLGDAASNSALSFLRAQGIPADALLIGIHPGARIATRRWGDERFAEVARRVVAETDAHVLWFSEPGDAGAPPPLERCHPAKLEFRPFLSTLGRCRLLVCNDSGPMHLAGLLGVPVVAVFGPQQPEWFGPRGPNDRVVIRPEFWCRPCQDSCIFDQPYCLRTIEPDQVIRIVLAKVRDIQRDERPLQPVMEEG